MTRLDRPGAREIALDVLLRVERGGAYAAPTLESELKKSGLERRDRALATELVFGILRWRGALDLELAQRVERGLDGLDATVLACLRLGAYQLLGGLRIPPHAAVSESVTIAKARRGKGPAGLVNGVLRKLAKSKTKPLEPIDALPKWLSERFANVYGSQELLEIARASTEQPWTGIRLEHRSGLSREELASSLLEEVPTAVIEIGSFSPLALRTRRLGQIQRLSGFESGAFSVQDEGAQLCAMLCDTSPGQKILDACSGRGGKTTLLASCTLGSASIDAADRHPRKLKQLEAELVRIGLDGVRTVAVDLERGSAGLDPPYDRILLDVPCSGTGTLSRRPEIKWRLNAEDVERLVGVQARLLDRCFDLLRPGGALVYCACSLLPEEGEHQVVRLLRERRAPGERAACTHQLRLLPHRHETDGFYAARLVREGPLRLT